MCLRIDACGLCDQVFVTGDLSYCIVVYPLRIYFLVPCSQTDDVIVSGAVRVTYVGGKVRVSEFMIFLTLQHWGSK